MKICDLCGEKLFDGCCGDDYCPNSCFYDEKIKELEGKIKEME